MIHSFEPEDPNKNTAEEFLNYLALLSDGDVKEEDDKVKMMTIHCSKGLQFKYVFISDFNEGYIPSSKVEEKEDIYEERRVAYVAFTRAQDGLFLLESKGDDGQAIISSFSKDLDSNNYLINQYVVTEKESAKTITVGSYVRSKYYGNGYVKSIDSVNKKCVVQFDDYYKEKEVDLNSIINLVNRNRLSFSIDTNIVDNIKKTNDISYSVGEIVIHKDYGAGIITRINNNEAYIQFREIGSTFDLNSSSIVKRNDYLLFSEIGGDKNG